MIDRRRYFTRFSKLIRPTRKINNNERRTAAARFLLERDKMGGNISRYVSLAGPIGKISPFVSIVTENQCAFFTSRRTMGKGNAEASEAVLSHCDFSIRVFSFPETPSICWPGSIQVSRMFRSHSGRNATGTVLINGTSAEPPHTAAINLNRRDTRFSNKALQ